MSPDKVRSIIKKFGTQQQIAEALNIEQTAVSGWQRRGTIPLRQAERLLVLAVERGIDLSPADFFEIGSAA